MRLSDFVGMRINGLDVAEVKLNGQILYTAAPPVQDVEIGQRGPGTGETPSNPDRAWASKFVMPEDGVMHTLYALTSPTAATGANLKLFIATESTTPATILVVSAGVACPGPNQELAFPIDPTTLVAGTYFWGFVPNSFQGKLANVSAPDQTTYMENGGFSYASPPSTWPVTGTNNYANRLCIWGVYTPLVTGCPPKPADDTRVLTCPAGEAGTWTQKRTYSSAPYPTCWVAGDWEDVVNTCAIIGDGNLNVDLSYVDTGSSKYTAFKAFVDQKLTGGNPSEFKATDAVYMYLISADEDYAQLAVDTVEEHVVAAEAAIAGNTFPVVAGDSYLHVGKYISDVALTYYHCQHLLSPEQITRWLSYADQAVYNVWNHETASWGGNPFPWSGWSRNDPGNNYFYSFVQATEYLALAKNDTTLIGFLVDDRYPLLTSYTSTLVGGGSREGTGYGVSARDIFQIYQQWADSGMGDLANANSHLTDSLYFWVHATMPTLDRYMPIGDLARASYPSMFDYHRELVLKARNLTDDQAAKDISSWWLNNISVQNMQHGFERRFDLLPAGNFTTPPTDLVYVATGTGNIFARSSWEENATFVHFIAGIYDQSHAHREQGGFSMFGDQDFLTVTNNIFSSSGIQQGGNCHNVLRFMNGGTQIDQSQSAGDTVIQALEYEIEAGSFYAEVQLAPNYTTGVTSWVREATFDGANTLLVVDNYATTGGVTAIFQVNVPVLPVVNGNVITAGSLTITVSEPAAPTIDVVSMPTVDADFTAGYRIDISGGSGQYIVELVCVP